MGCPYFRPESPVHSQGRLPLGAAYLGTCHADPSAPHAPPESHQRDLCNLGYARGRCDRFPAGSSFDAVRFSVTAEGLVWVAEKDHAPVEHGSLTYIDGRFDPAPRDEMLAAQARAFAASYLS